MKTITTAKLFTSTFILSFFILLFSCSTDDGASESPSGTNGDEMTDDTGNTDSTDTDDTVSISLENSVVQKGPFLEGSTITIVELDDNLESTNVSYTTETIDDFGSFSFTRELSTNYVDVITTGFYFNEVSGELSSGQVTLRNFVDASSSASANINILTTLARPRIKYLIVNEEKSYAEAKAQAEQEVLASFNIPESAMASALDFEALDISKSGEGNAILLAVSSVIQGWNNAGELSELMTKFANDLEDDGTIEDSLVRFKIAEGNGVVVPVQVRQNLEERFGSLNVDFEISDFGFFIDSDNNGLVNGLDVTPLSPIGTPMDLTQTRPLFSWKTSDNLENTYDLQVSDNEDFSNLLLDVNGLSGGQFQSEVLLERGQIYYWRVRMVTEEGAKEWKTKLVLFPYMPIVNLGLGGNRLYTQNSRPTFSWDEIPLEGVRYEVELASDGDFQDILFNSGLLSENMVELDYILPGEGEYYMRVRYIEANGVVSEWYWSPNPFEFELPFISSLYFNDTCDLTPSVNWGSHGFGDRTDPLSFEYDIQLSLNESYSELILNSQSVEAIVVDTTADINYSYELGIELQVDTIYYIRVRIRDGNGVVGEWYEYQNSLLGIFPINDYTISPNGTTSEVRPILNWEPRSNTQCEVDELYYELQLAPDNGLDEFNNPLFNELLLDVRELTETGYQVPFNLEVENKYHCRVRYHDGQGNYSDWAVASFIVDPEQQD